MGSFVLCPTSLPCAADYPVGIAGYPHNRVHRGVRSCCIATGLTSTAHSRVGTPQPYVTLCFSWENPNERKNTVDACDGKGRGVLD